MSKEKIAAVLVALMVMVVWQSAAQSICGKVTKVSDGDTVWITDAANERHKIRLARIDAPEKSQPWGKESAAVLRGWVFEKNVRVEYTKRDKYGRILGTIFCGTNEVNLAMVQTGNAWHYNRFDRTTAYSAAESAAKVARLGLWSQPDPIDPFAWRKRR